MFLSFKITTFVYAVCCALARLPHLASAWSCVVLLYPAGFSHCSTAAAKLGLLCAAMYGNVWQMLVVKQVKHNMLCTRHVRLEVLLNIAS